MKQASKVNLTISNEEMRENILRSLIASFKIEKINISESTAQEIYKKVKKKLKK
jgi:glucuronate isomerase